MSGRQIMIAGRLATVPDDQYDGLVKQLDADGVDFGPPPDVAKRAELAGVEPGGPPAQGGATPGFEPDPNIKPEADKPWYSALADAFQQSMPGAVLSRAADNQTYNAAAQGLAHGATMGLDQNIPGYGDYVRDERAAASSADPAAYAGGDLAGAMALPLPSGGVLKQAAGGALQGGARGFSDADPEHRAISGLVGAGVGAAAPLALGAIAAPFNKVSDVAQSVGDSARLSSMGVGKQALTDFADKGGLMADEARRAFVQRAEDLVPPNRIIPRSTGGWEAAAKPVANGLGQDVDQALMDAYAQGSLLPQDVRGNLEQSMYQAADAKLFSGMGGALPESRALANEAQAIGRGPQITDPVALRQSKTLADQYAYRGTPGTPEAASGMASLEHGNAIRGLLGNFVGQASPETQAAYGQAAGDYGIASTIQNQARDRALGMAASGPTGARSMVGRTLDTLSGGGVVPDAFANTARGIEGLTGAVGGGMSWLARDAPTGSALAVAMDQGRPTPSGNPSYDRQTAAGESRGYQLSQNLDRALATQPQLLGQYAQQFAGVDDPDQRAAIAERLARTDTRFARDVYPSLIGAR